MAKERRKQMNQDEENQKKKVMKEKGAYENKKQFNSMTAEELLKMDFPELKWILPDILPAEGLTLLCGSPKVGKSWLLLMIALAAASGGVALGKIQVEQRSVAFLALEDSHRRLKRRLEHLDGKPTPELTFVTEWPSGEKGFGALKEYSERNEDLGLIAIDTLQIFRGPDLPSDYGNDVEYLHGLQALSAEMKVPILANHHTRKATAEDPFHMISGTQGISGSADTNMVLARKGFGAADAVLHIQSRDFEPEDQALKFDSDVGWELLGSAAEYNQTTERLEVLEKLKDMGEPVKPSVLAKMLEPEKSVGAVQRLLVKLKNEGYITSPKYGHYECLK